MASRYDDGTWLEFALGSVPFWSRQAGNPAGMCGQLPGVQMSMRGRLRAGDPDAFRTLFDDYARAIYNHGFRLTGDWSTSEDIVALTFLEAWRLRTRVDVDGGSLRPWLLAIATNVARNISRASRRHAAAVRRMPAAPLVPDFADDLVERIDDAGRVAEVRAALARLRPGEQDVFQLCVWAGLDYVSAAQALGLPVGTVRSRLSRVRRKLQKHLGGPNGVPESGTRPCGGGQIDGDREDAVRLSQEMSQ